MKNILVIEDEKQMANLIKSNLKKKGFQITCAFNGKEGLEIARRIKPDLITLDIMMPDMDGIQVLQLIKNDPNLRGIPVIMISILAEMHKQGIGRNVVDYIEKPIDFDNLVNSIKKAMREISLKQRKYIVLIIDDEKDMVALSKQSLIKRGLEVICSYGGKEGVEIAKEKHPDIIILDLMMPEMNGFEVLKVLQSDPDTVSIPIIILTSSINDQYKKKCLALGAVEYLDKSFSENVIISEIEKHLGKEEK